MGKTLFLEGVDDLSSLNGIPLACAKTAKGEYKCTTIGKAGRVVGKGTVVAKLSVPESAKKAKAHAGRRNAFGKAAKACKGLGKGPDGFRACMQDQLGTATDNSRRDFIRAGKSRYATVAGEKWQAAKNRGDSLKGKGKGKKRTKKSKKG